jgi:hypothetical protein
LAPGRVPLWSPEVAAGCRRFGVETPADDPARSYDAVAAVYEAVLGLRPHRAAADLDHFFTVAAGSQYREMLPPAECLVETVLRRLRTTLPLKHRLRPVVSPPELQATVDRLAAAARESPTVPPAAADWPDVVAAITTPDDLPAVVGQNPWLAGDGLWLVAGSLHDRHPKRFPPWSRAIAARQRWLDDAASPGLPPLPRYQLLCQLAERLRSRYRVHPTEVGDLLARLGRLAAEPVRDGFGGFCTDTFGFLAELRGNNRAEWMAAERHRFHYAVRDPLAELCSAVAERYAGTVLKAEYRWEMETDTRPGRALSSVCKNDFGRSDPYVPELWATFYRTPGHTRTSAQLFIRVAADGVSFGFRLGRAARADGRRLRGVVQEHGQLLFDALSVGGRAVEFAAGDEPGKPLTDAAALREWAAGKELVAHIRLTPAEAVAASADLPGRIVLTFDRLVPLFAAAADDDPLPVLTRRAGRPTATGFDKAAFHEATLLGETWLDRAMNLLTAKRQLVLQGVPGTGKTHVARCLARHLTGDRSDLVATVQFHPAYSYEEFVEGLRPQPAAGGVAYPVQPGVLLKLAAMAAGRPADTHVLLVDEINRGNLPRLFGELLYLLEYRDQAVTLPYSKAAFRLPPNVYVIATLNPADRSVTALDQATRRRFAFLDMPPDPMVLSRWLARHPPADPDPEFGAHLVRWFEELNRRLARDHGPDRQVGHTYWLRDNLTREAAADIWAHEVLPALADLDLRNLPSPDRTRPRRRAVR